MASAYGVAELPGRVGKVFFSEKLKRQAESDCRFRIRCIATGDSRILQYLPEAITEFCTQFHKPWGTGFGICRPGCFPGGKDTRM